MSKIKKSIKNKNDGQNNLIKILTYIENFLSKFSNTIKILKYIITIVITLIITGYVANQVVQPLFKPRISEIKIEPLYIQNIQDEYYLIAKMRYNIEVPLFTKSSYTQVKFPRTAEINVAFKQKNPYMDIDIFEERRFNFKHFDYINITINTNGLINKNLEQVFYVREKLDKDRLFRGHFGYSDYYLWNDLELYPALECDVAKSRISLLGYGVNMYKQYESFSVISIRNNCNLDIKSLTINVWGIEGPSLICEGENEVTAGNGNLKIDIKAGETKNILLIKKQLDQFDKENINYSGTIIFNWTYQYNSKCFYAWRKYQQLGNKI